MQSKKLSRRDFLKLGMLLPLAGLPRPQVKPHPPVHMAPVKGETIPNILIILFDTFSARHLSIHGYQRETTPNIARFAEKAFVFQQHYASGSFTTPGTTSLLTGTYPWKHHAFNLLGTASQEYGDKNLFALFNASHHTLFYSHNPLVVFLLQNMRQHLDSYTSADELCLVNQRPTNKIFSKDFNPAYWSELRLTGKDFLTPNSLFAPLLDKWLYGMRLRKVERNYRDMFPLGLAHNYHGQAFILEDAIDWIDFQVRAAPRPFLGYFHLWAPHGPYNTRVDFVDIFQDGWDAPAKPEHHFSLGFSDENAQEQCRQYDEYIAYVDTEFGRLLDSLERSRQLENTILVLTSDHGEMFERGIVGHLTETLYEPIIRIPLLISLPGQQQGITVTQPTSAVDVLPTLLSLTGQKIPEWIEGRVLPPLGGGSPEASRMVFAMDARSNAKQRALRIGTLAAIQSPYKLHYYFGYEGFDEITELYNIEEDPEELHDIAKLESGVTTQLKDALLTKLTEVNQGYF